jgi:hypothetical protein
VVAVSKDAEKKLTRLVREAIEADVSLARLSYVGTLNRVRQHREAVEAEVRASLPEGATGAEFRARVLAKMIERVKATSPKAG